MCRVTVKNDYPHYAAYICALLDMKNFIKRISVWRMVDKTPKAVIMKSLLLFFVKIPTSEDKLNESGYKQKTKSGSITRFSAPRPFKV